MSTLASPDGQVLASPSVDLDLLGDSGTTVAIFSVATIDLNKAGLPSPWSLTDIRLFAIDAGFLPSSTLPDHTTAFYPFSSLEVPQSPALAQVLPASGARQGGNQVQLLGTGLDTVTAVRVGDKLAEFSITGPGSLLVTVPPAPAMRVDRVPHGGQGPPTVHSLPVRVTVSSPWGEDVREAAYVYE